MTLGEARGGTDRQHVLADGVVAAIRATEGYGGGLYLPSRDGRSLVLAVVSGVPRSLLRRWWRIPIRGRLPASDAYRTGQDVHLCDPGETMRRYPLLSAELPYPFACLCTPVHASGQVIGVLFTLRSVAESSASKASERRALRAVSRALGYSLEALGAPVHSVEYDGEPMNVRLPAEGVVVRVGLFDWDLETGSFTADDEGCAILGTSPESAPGTIAELRARVIDDDVHEVRACVRDAVEQGRVRARRFRVLDDAGRARPVEMWGRIEPPSRRLRGALVDAAAGAVLVEAAHRLPDGVFALDQDGRFTFTNRRLEDMLGAGREDLLGRCPWEVLPWLSDAAYEDRYRAAMLSQEATSFLVRHPEGEWLAIVLYPDVQGLTGRVFWTGPPQEGADTVPQQGVEARAAPERYGPTGPPLPVVRPGALYHVVHMASVLTEAVTVRQVCSAVSEQLLPAFGGQELALYLIREGRMYLAAESGYPEGFLDMFEGVPLNARLPGVEALTSGAPIFFESARRLITAYPGIALDRMSSWAFLPLIASGHPVGSLILGFDTPRSFSTDERSALTALGGLVAQALERARLYDAEFTIARGLQNALLPHRLPGVPGLESTARYLPGTQGMDIGGDWYDVVDTGSGMALVVGDVEGHSVAAAAVMGQLRTVVSAHASSGRPPQEVIGHTNRLLVDLDPGALATVCYVHLVPETGRAVAVRAGHPPPLLKTPGERTRVLDLPGGPLLGVATHYDYPVTELRLPRGSLLALYTDGLVERPGADIDEGIDFLRSLLDASPSRSLESLADRLVREARRATERPDDVALLLTRYIGE